MRVSVVGGGTSTTETESVAERVGRRIAERGHTLVCGGRTGVMEAACRGASDRSGRTIGILPGTNTAEANPYVDVPIATGIGEARNVMVALNGDGVVAIDGRYGTLSEIAHALNAGRPVAGLGTHRVDGLKMVETAEEAITYLERAIE